VLAAGASALWKCFFFGTRAWKDRRLELWRDSTSTCTLRMKEASGTKHGVGSLVKAHPVEATQCSLERRECGNFEGGRIMVSGHCKPRTR